MVRSLGVQLIVKSKLSEEQPRKYETVARSCPVYRSLAGGGRITITFVNGDGTGVEPV